jgi:para-nitrobenzyl esterase
MTLAHTSLGTLRGIQTRTGSAWLGVPYAQPPVGMLRFRAPAPAEPWQGERDATRFAPAAPQFAPDSPVAEPMVKKVGTSEDCLYLNIWSPAADSARRPVLFWIHGGAFMMGTGATYDGAELSAIGDIVVVTINYRLGALGFVNFRDLWNDDRFDSNVGLLDQIAALRWVRDHIAAFGGDPARVTIAGESAGAVSVSLLTLVEEARPLFRAAIAQSGSVSLVGGAERSRMYAEMYARGLGVHRDSAEKLFALSPDRFTAVHAGVALAHRDGITTKPILDGRLLPATSHELFTRPTAPVPMLLGSNRDEATLFALLQLMPTTWEALEPTLRQRLPADRIAGLLAAYSRDYRGALRLSGDATFTIPMVHFADRHARHAPTWKYRFDWATPAFGGQLGAMHALELFLMWMDPERRGVQMVLGGVPSAELRALADRMKRYWVTFVRELDPGPGWPRYDARRSTLVFDLDDKIVDDPEVDRRIAWDGLDGVDD